MILKKIIRITFYLVISILVLIIILLGAVNLQVSHRYITSKANEIFIEKGLPVHVDGVSLLISGKIGLNGVSIIRDEGDTIIYAGRIKVSVRILPLITKKLKAGSLTIQDAVVNLSTDENTRQLNLISLFSEQKKSRKTEAGSPETVAGNQKSGKKWIIGLESVSLRNVRFSFTDKLHGLYLTESVGKLGIEVERLSLADREIFAKYIEIKKAHGGISLTKSQAASSPATGPVADWKFRLTDSDLKDIIFTLNQPENGKRSQFSLGRCELSDAGFELASHKISFTTIKLDKPGAVFYSSGSHSSATDPTEKRDDRGFPGSWKIAGENLEITEGSLHSLSDTLSDTLHADNSLLQVANLSTKMRGIILNSTEAGFSMNSLSVSLDNGFRLNDGEISFKSDSTPKSRLTIKLRTASSNLELDLQAGKTLPAIMKSWSTVPVRLNVRDSKISAHDLLTLFPGIRKRSPGTMKENWWLDVDIAASGTADSLEIGNINLSSSEGAMFSCSGKVTGITNPRSSHFSADFNAGSITRQGIDAIMKMTGSASRIPEFGPVTINGNVAGTLSSSDLMASVRSTSGNLTMIGFVDIPDKSYKVRLTCSGIDAGTFTGIKEFEKFSGKLEAEGKGFDPGKLKIRAALIIDSARYKGYTYHDIHFRFNGDSGKYIYSVNSADSSFRTDMKGSVTFSGSSAGGKISGSVHIDAGKLNIYHDLTATCNLDAELKNTGGDLKASAIVKNLIISNKSEAERLESFSLSFHNADTIIEGDIRSDFLNADFLYNGSFTDLGKVFEKEQSTKKALVDSAGSLRIPYLASLGKINAKLESTYHPVVGLLLNDSVLNYRKIGLYLRSDTIGIVRAGISADRFSFGNGAGYGADILIVSNPGRTQLFLKTDSLKYSNLYMADLLLYMKGAGDTAIAGFMAGDRTRKVFYDIQGELYRTPGRVNFRATKPVWVLNGYKWQISPGEFLVIDPKNKDLKADFHWRSDQRSIDFFGQKSESIILDLQNVWINMLVPPGISTKGFDGGLTGRIEYRGTIGSWLGIKLDLNQLKLNEKLLGNLKIEGNYSADTTGTVKSEIGITLNDTSKMNARIKYGNEPDQKSFQTRFSGIPLKIMESFAGKVVSDVNGYISGEADLNFPGNKPVINGSLRFNKTDLKIVPLNARFYLPDDIIKLENNQISFTRFSVHDSLGKKLTLDGTINLKDHKKITSDLKVFSDHLQVLNTTVKDNPAFYGSVFVDTKLSVTGTVNKPLISGSIVLAEGTVLNYEYKENLDISETEKIVTFTGPASGLPSGRLKPVSGNQFSKSPNIRASIEIDPKSLFNFQISKGYDISVGINGGGFLNYELLPNNTISLNGTYEIKKGSSTLKLPGWPRKDFSITTGSYVKWNGAVDDPELHLEMTSKVRGSYYNPVDSKTREVDFVVYMKLADKLEDLKIVFDVGSNDQYITSVLNTLSGDEKMKQAINLLIFERIDLPNLSSSSDYVSQQINQFWESQINRFTKSAIKKVDLSFGIDTHTGSTKDGGAQTYTSLSYQVKKDMFNDRASVLVSGRMNDASSPGSQTNTVIENFIFEYALDSSRSKYLKVYRKNDYEDMLEGQVIKSGIGFIYRKSYDKVRDIWRRPKKADFKPVPEGRDK